MEIALPFDPILQRFWGGRDNDFLFLAAQGANKRSLPVRVSFTNRLVFPLSLFDDGYHHLSLVLALALASINTLAAVILKSSNHLPIVEQGLCG